MTAPAGESLIAFIGQVVKARVSPDHRSLAVSIPETPHQAAPVYEIDADGQNKRTLVDEALDFYWSPDGKEIIYAHPQPPPQPRPSWLPEPELPVPMKVGYEWHILNLLTAEDDLVTHATDACAGFVGWSPDGHILFKESNGLWRAGASRVDDPEHLIVFDRAKRMGRVDLFKGLKLGQSGGLLAHIEGGATSPNGRHTVVQVSLWARGAIYELTRAFGLGRRIVFVKDGWLGNPIWNGNDRILFVKWTHLRPGQGTPSGAVYQYDFRTRRVRPAFGVTQEYSLQGTLGGKSLIIVTSGNGDKRGFVLESTRLDGTDHICILSRESELAYYAWIAPI